MSAASEISSLAGITRYWAGQQPDKAAQVFQDRHTSYRLLDQYASRVANGLIALGVRPQERVAFLDKNSDLFFELLYGSAKSNCVIVGINWRLAPPEVAYVINDSQAKVLFVGPDFYELVNAIRDDIPNVTAIISMDGVEGDWPDFQAWRDGQAPDEPGVAIASEDVAIQLYTSGTTGNPKGVELTNANYMATFENFLAMNGHDTTEADVTIVCMPVFHVAGTNMGLIGAFSGATNIITAEANPAEILADVEKYGITIGIFVPALIRTLLLHPEISNFDLSSLRTIFYGASPISLDVLKQAMDVFGCEFVQLYGLTETTGQATYLPAADHDPKGNDRMRSCGIAMANIELMAVDDQGKSVPTGEIGEVWIRTDTLMKGYYNRPDATLESINDERWFKSGDIGYLDDDGYLYLYDRVKDMIISGGENVYPAEVENSLMNFEAISDVAVIGIPDEKWGEAVKAIVVLHDGAEASEAEILGFARTQIAGFKTPKSIDFVEELPRNPSGKVLKRVLREPYWKDAERQVG